jgi:hypothetical protein
MSKYYSSKEKKSKKQKDGAFHAHEGCPNTPWAKHSRFLPINYFGENVGSYRVMKNYFEFMRQIRSIVKNLCSGKVLPGVIKFLLNIFTSKLVRAIIIKNVKGYIKNKKI